MDERAGARRRRARIRALTSGLLAILLAMPVAADTVLSESGRTGPHLLVDTAASPGARCDYSVVDGGLRFAQMEVQPPVVYPAGKRLRQKVSWSVALQRKRPGSGGWRTKLTTDTIVMRSTASAPAAFADRGAAEA